MAFQSSSEDPFPGHAGCTNTPGYVWCPKQSLFSHHCSHPTPCPAECLAPGALLLTKADQNSRLHSPGEPLTSTEPFLGSVFMYVFPVLGNFKPLSEMAAHFVSGGNQPLSSSASSPTKYSRALKLQLDQHNDIPQLSDCSLHTCKTNTAALQAPEHISLCKFVCICAHICSQTRCIKVKGVEFSL